MGVPSWLMRFLDKLIVYVTTLRDGFAISFAPNIATQFRFTHNSQEIGMGNITQNLTDLQEITIGVESDNVLGKPAPQETGTVASFATDVTGVVTVVPADDGTSVKALAVAAGTAVTTVAGIAVDGSKFSNTITWVVTVDPRKNIATQFKFTPGTPTDQ